jgi:hypothetical protein
MTTFYGIFDNITNEALSHYCKDPDDWDWTADCWDEHNRARNFHMFTNQETVLEAFKHVNQLFLEGGHALDFQIYTLYNPKTETTWAARPFKLPEEKSK